MCVCVMYVCMCMAVWLLSGHCYLDKHLWLIDCSLLTTCLTLTYLNCPPQKAMGFTENLIKGHGRQSHLNFEIWSGKIWPECVTGWKLRRLTKIMKIIRYYPQGSLNIWTTKQSYKLIMCWMGGNTERLTGGLMYWPSPPLFDPHQPPIAGLEENSSWTYQFVTRTWKWKQIEVLMLIVKGNLTLAIWTFLRGDKCNDFKIWVVLFVNIPFDSQHIIVVEGPSSHYDSGNYVYRKNRPQ